MSQQTWEGAGKGSCRTRLEYWAVGEPEEIMLAGAIPATATCPLLAARVDALSCEQPTACRAVREAFGEAYDEQAAARAGKRQKRGAAGAAAAAAAAAADPTRARVETLLAASSQGVVRRAAAVAAQDVIQENI